MAYIADPSVRKRVKAEEKNKLKPMDKLLKTKKKRRKYEQKPKYHRERVF